MLGGAYWATGEVETHSKYFAYFGKLGKCLANLMSIPTINRLGMCLGILIWNSVNCIAGFLVSYVGLFGIDSQPTSTPALSFIGLPMVLVG